MKCDVATCPPEVETLVKAGDGASIREWAKPVSSMMGEERCRQKFLDLELQARLEWCIQGVVQQSLEWGVTGAIEFEGQN